MRASRYKAQRNGAYGFVPQLQQHGSSAAMAVVLGVAQVIVTVPKLRAGDTFLYARQVAGGTLGELSILDQTPGSPGFVTIASDNAADTSTIVWTVVTDQV